MANELISSARGLMPLCTLFAAVLSACGGADGGATTADATDLAASTDSSALKAPSLRASMLASEGGTFSVSGAQIVQYGAGSRWVKKSISGAGQCTNAFFGNDPAVGTVKSCLLVSSGGVSAPTITPILEPVPAPAPIAAPAPVAAPAPSSEVTPAPTPVAAPTNVAAGVPITAWVRLAMENEAFSLNTSQTVRIGDGAKWVSKTMSGDGNCSVNFFGGDPAYGAAKFCEVQVTVPGVVQTGTLPVVNTALMPKPATAYSTARLRTLSVSELLQAVFQAASSDIGSFREPCHFSHMAYDDPIVYPGQPGKSHLHTFFGNSQAGAASTGDSLMNSGNSTCSGGTLNRTAYWMPTLIDIRTGQPLVPTEAIFYYKLGYNGVKTGTVQTFPKGLRMIAGDSNNTLPIKSSNVGLECMSGGGHQPSMPNCAVGDKLNVSIIFPQCWDGINLDSPDHKSHMAYPTGNGCPSTHPVALPEIALNVEYKIGEANIGSFLKFSSDNYAGPGGHSLHADWFNGWDTGVNKTFTKECLNSSRDCRANLLGDGTTLY